MTDEGAPTQGRETSAQRELPRRKPDWWRYTNASSIGIEIAVAIVMGWLAGSWLESNVTHWKPWTSVIGLLLGCGAAVLAMFRTVREHRDHQLVEAAERAQDAAGPPVHPGDQREPADVQRAD